MSIICTIDKLKVYVFMYKWESVLVNRNRIYMETHILIDYRTIILIKTQAVHILIDSRTIMLLPTVE